MQNEELKLLSISEAAKLLGIGRRSLHSLIQDKRINVQRIGKRWKIAKSALVEFINHENTIPITLPTTNKQEYSNNQLSIEEFIKTKIMEVKNGINL